MASIWRFLKTYLFQSGAAIAFVAPIFVNFVISWRFGVSEATGWVLSLAWASWLRLTFSSKFIDLGNRFAGLSKDKNAEQIVISRSLLLEFGFTLIQLTGVFIAYQAVEQIGPQQAILMLTVVLGQSLRDQALFLLRLKKGTKNAFSVAWVDGCIRLLLLTPLIAATEITGLLVALPFIGLAPLYIGYIGYTLITHFRTDTHRLWQHIDGYKAFFFIQHMNTFLRIGYQNIDVIIVPLILSGEPLWLYVTLRQLVVNASALSVGPKAHATIPNLVRRFSSEPSNFSKWLARIRWQFLGFSALTISLGCGVFVVWAQIVDADLAMLAVIGSYLITVGLLRSNMWWNKDLMFFWHPFTSSAQSIIASALSLSAAAIAVNIGQLGVFLICHAGAFAFIALSSEVILRLRLLRAMPNAKTANIKTPT